MSNSTDHRKAAAERIEALAGILRAQPASDTRDRLLQECSALAVAIAAFHMEGIRFRMFNVDRLLAKGDMAIPDDATAAFADARQQLEAAGFHTRSHQAPQ